MAKIELNSVTSGYNLSAINDNFQRVEDELKNKVMYVDEASPMERALDMNGQDIINAGSVVAQQIQVGNAVITEGELSSESSAVLRGDLASAASGKGGDLVNMNDMHQQVQSSHTTTSTGDTFFAYHTATGASGSGYGFHSLDAGDGAGGGGAIGGATERTSLADAIVGNRRGSGAGNGVLGSRWESGDGSGVTGVMRGSGQGHGVYGYKVFTNVSGHAVHGRNESTTGAGVYGLRLNGAGDGHGVMGYASGNGSIPNNCASVFAQKLSGDSGPAMYADGRGTGFSLFAFGAANNATVAKVLQDATSTADVTASIEKQNGTSGMGLDVSVSGSGARTSQVTASRSIINPASASTGTSSVVGHDVFLGSTITGSSNARGLNISVNTGASQTYGVVSVVNGSGAANYGVYGNAVGGTVNWSGYFVGNAYVGGTITNPSDRRLKDIHHQLDGAQALANVCAAKSWVYDKYAVWTDDAGQQHRDKVAVREVGPIAQELQDITPDHVTEVNGYLAVTDRSELYQLKAAVAHLAGIVEKLQAEK